MAKTTTKTTAHHTGPKSDKAPARSRASAKPPARTTVAADEPDPDPIGAGKAAEENTKANREAAKHVRKPIPVAPNPPEQPTMVPAKQVPGAVGNAVPGMAAPKPLDHASAIRVQAIDNVYYDNVLRRAGDVFDIANENEFSKRSMIRVPPDTPEKVTGSNESLERDRKGRTPDVKATGDDDVLGSDKK